jgi:hypothetical protein
MLNHEIERYTEKNADYKKELLLINMLLDKRTNREEKFNRDFQNYVAMPLNFRQRFQVPLSVFSGFYSTFTLRSVFEKLKPFLTARDKIIAEVHMKLELGEISAAQALYTSYQSLIEDPADLANLRLQLDYALKDYTAVVTQEKTLNVSKLNIASHYVLLLSKQKLNTQATSLIDDGISTHSNFIRSEKNILGLWAQLVTMEPSKRMMFVQSNSGAGEDFIPFLEIKGSVE